MEAQFGRLLTEQKSAMQLTDTQISKLAAFSKEYSLLKPKLEDLARCFTRQTLIPFSPRALVPATLIHTNEVLVHLGGDQQQFAEMSTFQALRFLDRRVLRIEKDIEQLRSQKKLLSDREAFTNWLNIPGQVPGENNEFEIREEYDIEQEKEWLQRHKNNVLTEKLQNRKTKKKTPNVQFAGDSDSSSSYEEPKIVFEHSCYPLVTVVEDIVDWCKASPADVSAMVKKQSKIAKKIAAPKSCLKNKNKSYNSTSECGDSLISASVSPPLMKYSNPLAETIVPGVIAQEHPSTRESPFLDVVERSKSTPAGSGSKPSDSSKPISKFRSLRKHEN